MKWKIFHLVWNMLYCAISHSLRLYYPLSARDSRQIIAILSFMYTFLTEFRALSLTLSTIIAAMSRSQIITCENSDRVLSLIFLMNSLQLERVQCAILP